MVTKSVLSLNALELNSTNNQNAQIKPVVDSTNVKQLCVLLLQHDSGWVAKVALENLKIKTKRTDAVKNKHEQYRSNSSKSQFQNCVE